MGMRAGFGCETCREPESFGICPFCQERFGLAKHQADAAMARLRAQQYVPSSALEAQMYEIERATSGGASRARLGRPKP